MNNTKTIMEISKKLLIPFFTAGFPQLSSTKEILENLSSVDADYVEIGLALSDALADGPVIQSSSHIALQNGMNIELLFNQISEIKTKELKPKLILFSYYNPLLSYGLEKSCRLWKEAGGNSILVPDLPIEEADELKRECAKNGLSLIFLVAPTSTEERIKKIAKMSTEFIYLVSVTGVTGVRETNKNDLSITIEQIKKYNPSIPVVIGFGIGDAQSAKQAIAQGADGVVIGSAIIKLLKDNELNEMTRLLLEIKKAIN